MVTPATEESGKIKGAAVGRRRRRVRTVMGAMVRSMRETSTTSTSAIPSGTSAATATATTSSGPLRASSTLVLLGSDFLGVRDVQSLVRRAAIAAGGSVVALVLLLVLLIAGARVGTCLAGEPRSPDKAIGLRRGRRTWGTARRAVVRAGSANTGSSKGETGHERGKRSVGLMVNTTASGLTGIKVLNEVPEVHVVVRILVWTHDGCLYSVKSVDSVSK